MKSKTDKKPHKDSIASIIGATEEVVDMGTIRSKTTMLVKLLMTGNKKQYPIAVDDLSHACALVIKQGSAVGDLITAMKANITAKHPALLETLKAELGMSDFQLRKTHPDTLAGKALKEKVTILKKYKDTSLADVIEGILMDTLSRASKKYDADLGDFNFDIIENIAKP